MMKIESLKRTFRWRDRQQTLSLLELLLEPNKYIFNARSHHWTPPKGHIDPGESAMEAALRETREESGLEAAMLTVYEDTSAQIQYRRKGRPKVI